MIPETCREAALEYAKLGWRVLPLKPGSKLPRITNWTENATTSAEQIEDWWRVWPDSNVGIATGKGSGLAVLDVDKKSGVDGDLALDALIAECGQLPDTPQAFTPTGGYHLYFKHPGNGKIKNSAGKLGEGLDTRADGGFVVAPPSVIDGKHYEWEGSSEPDEVAPALAPPRFFTSEHTRGKRTEGTNKKPAFKEGKRNDGLTALGGSLRRVGLSADAIAEALLVTNGERCDPPLSEDEVRKIAESVGNYRSAASPDAFTLVHVAEVKRRIRAIPWAIEGVLEQGGHHMLFGAPESFKTFVALSMAAAKARGMNWYGRAASQCGVLYLVGEGYPGIAQRIKAWESFHGESLDDCPFYLSRTAAELTVNENVAALADAASQIDDLRFIVVDTLSRCFGPANENQTEDMRRYIALIDQYLRDPYNATVLHLHHPSLGDQTRGRGSSVLRATLEGEMRVERRGMNVYLSCTKAKNAPRFPAMDFHAELVTLSETDDDGNPITSLALDYRGEAPESDGRPKGKNQITALGVLRDEYHKHWDILEKQGRDFSEAKVLLKDWRDACKAAGMSSKRITEAISGLVSNGCVVVDGAMAYLPGRARPSE